MIIPILPLLNVEQCVVICSNNVIHITLAAWKEIFASSFIPSEFKPLFHCIPVLQIITEIGRVFIMLLYPPLNEVEGGYTGFTLSVRLRIILHVVLRFMAGMRRIGNAEIFSALSPRYGWNAEIMRRFLRIPVRILPSAFSPHFLRIFFHIGTRRNTRRFLRVPVRILPSAFSPHFLRIFFRIFCHTRMRRFLRVPVRILPSAFSPQGKCGDLGYGIRSRLFGLDPHFAFVFKKKDSDLKFCLIPSSWFQDWDFKIQIFFWSNPTGP